MVTRFALEIARCLVWVSKMQKRPNLLFWDMRVVWVLAGAVPKPPGMSVGGVALGLQMAPGICHIPHSASDPDAEVWPCT